MGLNAKPTINTTLISLGFQFFTIRYTKEYQSLIDNPASLYCVYGD